MKFRVENLGYLKKADIELADLTLICGKNNTGKTYLNYAIYGFLEAWDSNLDFGIESSEIEELLKQGMLKIDLKEYEHKLPTILDHWSKSYSALLPSIFNTAEDFFSEASFSVLTDDLDTSYSHPVSMQMSASRKTKQFLNIFKEKHSRFLEVTYLVENDAPSEPTPLFIDSVNKLLINKGLARAYLGSYFAKPFIITSERTGISLFYQELDANKSSFTYGLQNIKPSVAELTDIIEKMNQTLSKYARPVKDEIDFVRTMRNPYETTKSELMNHEPQLFSFFKEIVEGDFRIRQDEITFQFEEEREIPLHISSSMSKSLVDTYFYLKHIAHPGSILIMDEPELSLHPSNQRKMARLFVRLIRFGIKILITTHSDYLIKELNNLIILANEFEDKDKIMEKYGYTEDDILDKEKVRVYVSHKNSLAQAPIDDLGIGVGSFDDEIIEMNDMFDEMTMNMEIAYD